MRRAFNSFLLLVCLLLVGGVGYYLTEVRQTAEIKKIDDTIQLAKLERAQVSSLLVEQASSRELAEESLAKWKSRYKQIPGNLNTADMVLYLENLTAYGFERFDISLVGRTDKQDFSYYTFKVNALSTFDQMYRFVWQIENNREFYRINDLKLTHQMIFKENPETNLPRRYDMIDFSFTLDAYFNAKSGIAASEDELMDVPTELLPRRSSTHNSFYPIIRTDLPPNDEMLLDVEKATLISVVGDRAIFQGDEYQYVVSEGDRIYLGTILSIDPRTATVRVELNKGGNSFTVNLTLDVEAMDIMRESDVSPQPIDQ